MRVGLIQVSGNYFNAVVEQLLDIDGDDSAGDPNVQLAYAMGVWAARLGLSRRLLLSDREVFDSLAELARQSIEAGRQP